jgi:hypothetical protein
MSAWLAVLAQPTAPASTYKGRTPSRQPPELETPPLEARAERRQKHHDTERAYARRRPITGQLPRVLTGCAAARTHPNKRASCRAHSPAHSPPEWDRLAWKKEPVCRSQGNGSRRGVVKRVVLMLTNDSARKAT